MSMWNNAILVAIVAFVVTVVPGYLRTDPPVIIDGFTAEGFEPVREVFRQNFESGLDSLAGGSAFSAYHRGEKVVDLWGGYADAEAVRPWRQDTLTIIYSTTKGVAAICIAMLVDRGLLDYDKPVAQYWPEFAQKGKEKITVKQMMEHKSGLIVAPPPGMTAEVLADVARAGELVAASEPYWPIDGTRHGYQAITIGLLTNELLRRVDPTHRTMGQFIAEELNAPFDIDFFLGLPLKENHRAARSLLEDVPLYKKVLLALPNPDKRRELWHMVTDGSLQATLLNAGSVGALHRFNDPAMRALEVASVNGYTTAEGLAKLWGIMAVGGTDPRTNRTLLSPGFVESFQKADPPSIDRVLGLMSSFSGGMIVEESKGGTKMFGHVGLGGMLAYADPNHELGFAFVSSLAKPVIAVKHERSLLLIDALYDCIKARART